jgi:hypothetical protein
VIRETASATPARGMELRGQVVRRRGRVGLERAARGIQRGGCGEVLADGPEDENMVVGVDDDMAGVLTVASGDVNVVIGLAPGERRSGCCRDEDV